MTEIASICHTKWYFTMWYKITYLLVYVIIDVGHINTIFILIEWYFISSKIQETKIAHFQCGISKSSIGKGHIFEYSLCLDF